MRTVRCAMVVVVAAAVVIPTAMALAVVLPSDTLTLSTPNSTYNTLNMTVGLDITSPVNLGNQNQTQNPTITGSCSATFNAVFNPTSHQATIQDVTFNLQDPGQVSLQNVTFAYSYLFGAVKENITTDSILGSPYTPSPPSPVTSGLFPANQVSLALNGGTLQYSGQETGSDDLSANAITTSNTSSSSGTAAVSAPTMNGNVATCTTTVNVPMALSSTVTGSGYTATINATGTVQATGTFQFNFGPLTMNWNAASGDFTAGGNWDVGFAPRTSDTASIANGGSSTLSTIFPASPAAVWLGNGSSTSGTLTIGSGGSLACGAMILGQNGGSGTLVLNGGTLAAAAGNGQFVSGPGTAYVRSDGATINSNGFNVTIGLALQHDPALGGALDGGLTKAGNGIVTLAGANTYTGSTTISGGTLKLGRSTPGTNFLPATTALAIGNSGTLDLGGGTQTVASLSGSGQVVNSAGTLASLIVSGSAVTTFSGSINDASGGGISLEKIGAGKLVLSGTGSFEGGTTVAGGTLVLTNNMSLADRSNVTVGSASFFAAPAASSPVGQENMATEVAPVPEPGTLVLAAVLCGAAWAHRKRRPRRVASSLRDPPRFRDSWWVA